MAFLAGVLLMHIPEEVCRLVICHRHSKLVRLQTSNSVLTPLLHSSVVWRYTSSLLTASEWSVTKHMILPPPELLCRSVCRPAGKYGRISSAFFFAQESNSVVALLFLWFTPWSSTRFRFLDEFDDETEWRGSGRLIFLRWTTTCPIIGPLKGIGVWNANPVDVFTDCSEIALQHELHRN